MIRVLYPCDPSKNTKCTKEACGTMCTMTSDPTCAKDNWVYKDLRVIFSNEIALADVIFLNILKQEGEEHESNNSKA